MFFLFANSDVTVSFLYNASYCVMLRIKIYRHLHNYFYLLFFYEFNIYFVLHDLPICKSTSAQLVKCNIQEMFRILYLKYWTLDLYKELGLHSQSGPWMLDPWKFIIENVFSSLLPSNRLLTYLCKFLLCHYMLEMVIISSVHSWCRWQVHHNTVKHAFLRPSAQLSKPNSHLNFIGRFSWKHLFQ
jgi:hypothetical protein